MSAPLLWATAFAAGAALVTDSVSVSRGGGVRVPGDLWQSDGLRAAIAKMKAGFIGADLSLARTMGQCFAAVNASRPEKNRWKPAFPYVDLEDSIGASEQLFEALELALEWTDTRLAVGATNTRGLVRLIENDTQGGIGLPTFTLNTVAAARLREGLDLPDGWKLTDLGRQYRYAAQNYRSMLLLAGNGGGNPSHYLLATWWEQLWRVADWADTQGSPSGGEEWDESGVIGSVLVGFSEAGGWLVDGFARAGGAIAGVIGDAAWSVIATPPGMIAIVAAVWFVKGQVKP